MKTIIYMAMSVNGYVALNDDSAPFSDQSWENYLEYISKFQNMIVGRKTYEIMKKEGDLDDLEQKPQVVILTSNAELTVENIATSPQAALEKVKQLGFSEALIAGGATTNAAFLNAGLVNEVHLDIESQLFTQGVSLAEGLAQNINLSLESVEKLSESTLHAVYKVAVKSK
jgi:dihydrofolate reductase